MLPDGWSEKKLGNVAAVEWGNTSITKKSYVENGFPAYSASGQDGFLDHYEHDEKGIVLSAIGARCGRCFSASGKWTSIKNTITLLEKSEAQADLDYLFYYLNRNNVWPIAGGAQPFIGLGNARKLSILLPPLDEQQTIAEILQCVDDTIQKTQAVIDQTHKVKDGLLLNLLTRGIGHKKFKQTQWGAVPESWEQTSIGKLAEKVTSGSRGWAQYYSDEGAAFIRITNLQRSSIYLDLEDTKRVSLPKQSAEGQRTRLQPGDILISITADLGIIGYLPDDSLGEAYINQHIALARLNSKKVHSGFVAYQLSSPPFQSYIQRLNDAGAKAGLNLTTIRNLPVFLPPIAEQKRIFDLLSDLDKQLVQSHEVMDRYAVFKQGVMSDLLSGRVRVNGMREKKEAA